MTKTRRIIIQFCFFIAAAVCGLSQAHADEHEPPPPSTCLPTDPDYDPRVCVPIDGGLAFLLAAGIGYGVLKNRSSQRQGQKAL